MWQSEGVRLQKQHVPWRSRGRTSYRGCDYVVNTVSVKGNHWVYNRRLIEKEAEMRKRRSERETQREGMRKREKTCGLRVAEMEIKQHPHHTELYNHLLTHMLNSAPMTHTHTHTHPFQERRMQAHGDFIMLPPLEMCKPTYFHKPLFCRLSKRHDDLKKPCIIIHVQRF